MKIHGANEILKFKKNRHLNKIKSVRKKIRMAQR